LTSHVGGISIDLVAQQMQGAAMVVATPEIGDEASPLALGRRAFLGVAGLAAGVLLPLRTDAQVQLVETGTPQLTLGPFYPLDRPRDTDWDMTRVAGQTGRAQGTVIELVATVRAASGAPVAGARLDAWQTNGLGRYHHPSDPTGLPLDPAFQGLARLTTGADGHFRLRTVMPQPYARRQRHIHFDVSGRKRRLITQMFFPGEPNERDSLFPRIANDAQRMLAVARAEGERDGIARFAWDIVLAGE
jgi:protocatechuate 3,4-dioxygenase, beta subunit